MALDRARRAGDAVNVLQIVMDNPDVQPLIDTALDYDADDTPRLVLADALTEIGGDATDWGELIRLECEMAGPLHDKSRFKRLLFRRLRLRSEHQLSFRRGLPKSLYVQWPESIYNLAYLHHYARLFRLSHVKTNLPELCRSVNYLQKHNGIESVFNFVNGPVESISLSTNRQDSFFLERDLIFSLAAANPIHKMMVSEAKPWPFDIELAEEGNYHRFVIHKPPIRMVTLGDPVLRVTQ